MPINWQDKEVADRLLAAIIASYDNKINCTEIARLYGNDATYNAIENFLRKPKRVAAQLKAEADGKEAPAASPARKTSPAKKSGSPAKSGVGAGLGVKTGRVEKKKQTTPRKKEIKVEEVEIVEMEEEEEDYV